jgi:hypothetical protein
VSWPEHEKLEALDGDNQIIGAFLEWMEQHGMVVGKWHDVDKLDEWEDFGDQTEVLLPDHLTIQDRLAVYFMIDRERLDAEKMAMLDEIRETSPA